MKKHKIADILFGLLFIALLFIPLLKINTAEHVESEAENRTLTAWPGMGFHSEINAWYGHYMEDRIGFRESAIVFFNRMTYDIFHEFSESLHMHGKNDYIFPADEGYIKSYQRTETNEEIVDNLVVYLQRTSEYLEQKGIPFVFLAGLDKKSIYSRYFPESIHVKEDEKTTMELLTEKLSDADVPFVIPVQEFTEESLHSQIYNKKYDSAHWNDLGAFIGLQLVSKEFASVDRTAPLLSEEDFKLSYEQKDKIEFLDVPIADTIPIYTPVKKRKLKSDALLLGETQVILGTSMQHYYNKKAKTDKTILIFHDSYLQDNHKFFTYDYKEVYMISRQNYEVVQYYVNLLEPDFVLFENAERAFADDLHAYDRLRDITYQIPYGAAEVSESSESSASIGITLEGLQVQNGLLKGTDLTPVPGQAVLSISAQLMYDSNIEAPEAEETDSSEENEVKMLPKKVIMVDRLRQDGNISGDNQISGSGNYNIYIKYNGKIYEAGYQPVLAGNSIGLSGTEESSVFAAFRIDKMQAGTMEFIVIDNESGNEYSLMTLQIQE